MPSPFAPSAYAPLYGHVSVRPVQAPAASRTRTSTRQSQPWRSSATAPRPAPATPAPTITTTTAPPTTRTATPATARQAGAPAPAPAVRRVRCTAADPWVRGWASWSPSRHRPSGPRRRCDFLTSSSPMRLAAGVTTCCSSCSIIPVAATQHTPPRVRSLHHQHLAPKTPVHPGAFRPPSIPSTFQPLQVQAASRRRYSH